MSSQYNFQNHSNQEATQGKVKVTDLISRMNEEKKIEKKEKFSSQCCCCFGRNSIWHHFKQFNLNKFINNQYF
jgi:predicted methyltransferase